MEHKGVTIWFTGLSGAGKTTISREVEARLRAQGYKVEVLDGDVVRTHLTKGLGYSKEDRDENIRRIGFVAHLLTRNGVIVIVSAISPIALLETKFAPKSATSLKSMLTHPWKSVKLGMLRVYTRKLGQAK